MKETRGCGKQGIMATLVGKEKLTTCPLFFYQQFPATFRRLGELNRHMENGFLPDEGGLNDQSALTMAALRYFQTGLSQGREEKRKTK